MGHPELRRDAEGSSCLGWLPMIGVAITVGCEAGLSGPSGIPLEVTPDAVAFFVGDSTKLAALVEGPEGDAIPAMGASWTVTPAGIVSVGASGDLVALRPGIATVTATLGDAEASSIVRVNPTPKGKGSSPECRHSPIRKSRTLSYSSPDGWWLPGRRCRCKLGLATLGLAGATTWGRLGPSL